MLIGISGKIGSGLVSLKQFVYICRMKTTNIYILIDPETQQIRYVGKANNISQRYKAHLNRARKHQIHKLNWINSLKKKGLKPIIEVIDIVPIEDWIFWETYWISQFKTWGFNLINYTQGGDGATFANETSFKKGHISWNSGTKKPKILKGNRGKTENSIKNQFKKGEVAWNKGVTGYKTSKRKPVLQYDLEGNFIKEFESCGEAALELNCITENIRRACTGLSKTAKNFKWKYKYEQ